MFIFWNLVGRCFAFRWLFDSTATKNPLPRPRAVRWNSWIWGWWTPSGIPTLQSSFEFIGVAIGCPRGIFEEIDVWRSDAEHVLLGKERVVWAFNVEPFLVGDVSGYVFDPALSPQIGNYLMNCFKGLLNNQLQYFVREHIFWVMVRFHDVDFGCRSNLPSCWCQQMRFTRWIFIFCCAYFVGTSEPIFRHTLDGLEGDV